MYSRININLFHLFIILILWCHCCWLVGLHKESTNNTEGGERRLSSLLLMDFQPKKEKQWFYDVTHLTVKHCVCFYVHSIGQLILLFLEMANWRSVLRQKMVEKQCVTMCLNSLVLEELHWLCTIQIRYVLLHFCYCLL